jgi:hypothetical protein
MESTELRIGNIVVHEPTIDDWEEIIVKPGTIIQCEISPDSYEPVLLTNEWLLKLGFSVRDDKYAHKNLPRPGAYLYINHNGTGIAIENEEGFELCYSVELHYVHQLQNLYFVLTGEELTIS